MSCNLEPAIWSRNTGQQITCFDRCQLIMAGMSNIKEVHGKPRLCQPIFWSMAAMLRDSVVVRTRPRAIPLTMITIRKILHGFPFLSHDDYGAPLGGPSGRRSSAINRVCTMPSPVRKDARLQCFSRQDNKVFSHLLNPDWSIPISTSPEVCKVFGSFQARTSETWWPYG